MVQFVVSFQGKSHEFLSLSFGLSERGGNVGGGLEMERKAVAFAFEFLVSLDRRGEVGHGGTEYSRVAVGKFRGGGFIHLCGTFHVGAMNEGRIGGQVHRTGYQFDLSSRFGTGFSQGEAHLAA